ncbi:MAG: DNA methyltransferase [Candidatus Micrarchaeaceae archaeon]
MINNTNFYDLINDFNSINIKKIDEKTLEKIDKNKSIFRWSGQFPSKLIEYLLDEYGKKNVIDPFCGSGTVLFEAGSKKMDAYGFDINPAAIELSKLAKFFNIDKKTRKKYLNEVDEIIFEVINKIDQNNKKLLDENDFREIEKKLKDIKNEVVLNIFTNVLMRFSVIENKYTILGLLEANNINKKIIMNIPFSKKTIEVHKLNSKKLPILDNSIDLCITSPPYPGVFNYYKNYKKIAFLKKWNISEIKKEEIGNYNYGSQNANFLKYGIDLIKVLKEINRVLKTNGRLILIINENIKIKEKTIKNSIFLYLLVLMCNFKLVEKQERVYKNRNKENVIEDILHFVPVKEQILEFKYFEEIIKYILNIR